MHKYDFHSWAYFNVQIPFYFIIFLALILSNKFIQTGESLQFYELLPNLLSQYSSKKAGGKKFKNWEQQ